jgi:hypothetical protein
VVERSVSNKFQSKNSTPATPCLYKLNREHAFYSNSSSGGHILMLPPLRIYIEGEARQATHKLICSREFSRARFGHSEVFGKITNEWPSLLAPRDKIVLIIAFGRRFLVELPLRSSWLSQEISEILPSDGVIFYTNGSLCIDRAGAGVFLDTFRYKGILRTWLTCYGLPNRGICNSLLF